MKKCDICFKEKLTSRDGDLLVCYECKKWLKQQKTQPVFDNNGELLYYNLVKS